jgi:hypothetical protein
VQRAELRRKAAAKPGWYWLPSGGLDHLIDESIRTKHWRERHGLIEKKFERITSVTVRLDGPIEAMLDKGIYRLVVVPEDADVVYFSETGTPDPTTSGKVAGRSHETSAPRVSFLPVDTRGEAKTGPAQEWLCPIKLAAHALSTSSGVKVEWTVLPRSAEVRASFDGSDPATAHIAKSPLAVPPSVTEVRLVPMLGGRSGDEVRLPLMWLEDELSGSVLELYEMHRPGDLERRAQDLLWRARKVA